MTTIMTIIAVVDIDFFPTHYVLDGKMYSICAYPQHHNIHPNIHIHILPPNLSPNPNTGQFFVLQTRSAFTPSLTGAGGDGSKEVKNFYVPGTMPRLILNSVNDLFYQSKNTIKKTFFFTVVPHALRHVVTELVAQSNYQNDYRIINPIPSNHIDSQIL